MLPLRIWAATVVAGLVITAAVVGAYVGLARGEGGSPNVLFDAPSFALTDQLGRPVRSDDLRGKVVVANFVYTRCPDICPLLSAQMRALQNRLRDEGLLGDDVRLLSFTVDPERDTPEVLRAYAERHGADHDAWRFLTGPRERIVPLIVDGFYMGVQVLPQATGTPGGHASAHEQYEVMHSGRFVLIDREWRVRAVPNADEWEVEQAVQDIRRLAR